MILSFSGRTLDYKITKQGSKFFLNQAEAEVDEYVWIMHEGRRHKSHVVRSRDHWWVHIAGHTFCFEITEAGILSSDNAGSLVAPMPGTILEVLVKKGDYVVSGQVLMVMEAMKMEHRILAPSNGEIAALNNAVGDQVKGGATLLELKSKA